ncbi:MAG: glycosyl transferase, partial [Rhodopirellula sp. JB053]
MPDFYQHDVITTIHDLRSASLDHLEDMLRESTQKQKIGLVLPVTASDMRAEPFTKIVNELEQADYIGSI